MPTETKKYHPFGLLGGRILLTPGLGVASFQSINSVLLPVRLLVPLVVIYRFGCSRSEKGNIMQPG